MIKKSSQTLYQQKYTNPQLPGLTEEECQTYMRYLNVNCPYMNNKEITKKEYMNILTSICDYDPSAYPEQLGIRRVKLTDLSEQKAVESPVLGENLFPYQMINEKIDFVCKAKDIDLSGDPNYELAYQYYLKTFCQKQSQNINNITEEDFCCYGQALSAHCKQLDDGEKIKNRLEKAKFQRHQFMYRVHCIREHVEKYENPLVEMRIPVIQQQRKTFSTLEDRYLIYLTDLFGYGKWTDIVTFIRVSPVFVFDWWFRSRDEDEICSRVNRIIKAIAKENEQRGNIKAETDAK